MFGGYQEVQVLPPWNLLRPLEQCPCFVIVSEPRRKKRSRGGVQYEGYIGIMEKNMKATIGGVGGGVGGGWCLGRG